MNGIVLCGGISSRMGTDKGLLNHEGITWAQSAINKLSFLASPILLSVNESQFINYSNALPNAIIIKDINDINIHGPLLGLISAHLQYPQQDLFVLACDMPLMEKQLLVKLYDLYLTDKTTDVFLYTTEGEPEPLCGIYCAKGLSRILNMYEENKLIRHSMKFALGHLAQHTIPLKPDQKKYFKNFNAPADLDGA